MYTLCEDNLVPWLCYSFSDIILSVCLFMCVYMMLVALSMCLHVGAKCSNDRYTFKLLGGFVDRGLTGMSQVPGSRPDVFSCELKIHLRLWCIHCVRTILSPGCAIPCLIFHYQCVCSCVCI